MKQISTTALAKERNIEAQELFRLFTEKNWIYKKDGQWTLTNEGRMAGGDTRYNPKYGEYIVWPFNMELGQQPNYQDTISATKIGEHFNISSQKVNLYLSELGWIEKDKGGWIVTGAGQKNGGIQLEARNNKPYVVWSKDVISNKHLLREIHEATGELTQEEEKENLISESDDFRKKFPANLRTPDGHYVRSRAELIIDDFLYKNGIVHAYERKLNIDEDMYCDFYIPSQKVYIEFWGMEENEKYLERKNKKLDIYAKYKFKLIELNDADIENLDERFAAKLRKYDIIVD
jgi:hypothetical protein